MALIDFCRTPVMSVLPNISVAEAAKMMADKNIGSLVVVEENKPIGLLTDRDIVLRVTAQGKNPSQTLVREVMTPHPVVLKEEMGLFEAIESVKGKGVRRLPVVDKEGKLVGILTIDDIVYLLGQEMADIAEIIKQSAPDLP